MSDTSAGMVAFAKARLGEAREAAVTDEQKRYVQAMHDIVLLWHDIEPGYEMALATGDPAGVVMEAKARWAVLCAIGFIASARDDHPDFRPEWRP